jgi:NAD(P)-dependent dehydrogenase (short-subunit alcohol dehydrogenase family)
MNSILISGGTHGIGRATVELLLQRGFHVSTCARTEQDLEELERATASDNLLVMCCDIRRDDNLEAFVNCAVDRFGPISGVINNAGVACVGTLHEASTMELLEYFNLKVARSLALIKLALPKWSPAGGVIVNVAGAAGVDPTPLLGVAGVTNAALRCLSRTLADELAQRKIRVNTVNPGTLDTRLGTEVVERFAEQLGVSPELVREEMYGSLPLGRIPTPSDVANVIGFFLSPESEMITGAELAPDGGTLIRRLRG